MTREEMLEGNKLIANFVGLVPHNMFPEEYCAPDDFGWVAVRVNVRADYQKEDEEFTSFEDLFEFHSSWDWLMPVLEKIENQQFKANRDYYVKIGSVIGNKS